MLTKTWECNQVDFYHFFGLVKVIQNRTPLESPLSSFRLSKHEKIVEWSYFLSHSLKGLKGHLSSENLSLFRPRETNITKKDNIGVIFKFFSDSLNMKISSSDLVLFTLIKVFEENVCWAVVYLLFSLFRITYEKGHFGFFFKCFSDSLNMKNHWVLFLGTHKTSIERPIWD